LSKVEKEGLTSRRCHPVGVSLTYKKGSSRWIALLKLNKSLLTSSKRVDYDSTEKWVLPKFLSARLVSLLVTTFAV
jgi:hypothetical protein